MVVKPVIFDSTLSFFRMLGILLQITQCEPVGRKTSFHTVREQRTLDQGTQAAVQADVGLVKRLIERNQ